MDFFGRPNIEKMVRENDREGLYRALTHRDRLVQLEAAQALAEMGDGAGWRHLIETTAQEDDAGLQEAAAAILGDLGSRSAGDAHRVVPVLGEALKKAHGEVADTIRDVLSGIGGAEAENALRDAGYTATPEESAAEVSDYEAHFVRPVLPNTTEIEFLSAEQHLNNAVELREAELSERGLVECSLALWLKPDWAYAWYLRGVLFEDLERPFEAWLCYRRAVSLNPAETDAVEALAEMDEEEGFEPPHADWLIPSLTDRNWIERRDAAAGLGELGQNLPASAAEFAELLFNVLSDPEREVRFAAVYSLGLLGMRSAVLPLTEMKESSWLMRFAIIEALSRLGSVDGLVSVLDHEMEQQMNRNPAFSSLKDPLLGVEYGRMVEIGVLALERAGDLESLLSLAEGNAWDEEDDEDMDELAEAYLGEVPDDLEEELEAEEDLTAYVDEVGQLVSIALDRAARAHLGELDVETLTRLSQVPDLTLIDLSEFAGDEETVDEDLEEEEPVVVYDLSGLREAAQGELTRREG